MGLQYHGTLIERSTHWLETEAISVCWWICHQQSVVSNRNFKQNHCLGEFLETRFLSVLDIEIGGVHVKHQVAKSQDKNPRSQQSVNMLYCVFSMITTCFGLRKRPFSGVYHVIQNIKKKVAIRCN
jgi:hypothetical protein